MTLLEQDRHDRALRAAVAPPGWKNPEPAPRYDLVVLGGGTAGLVAAAIAAGLGAKVALIERELMGGDCLNYGCVPSKALLAAGRAFASARRLESFGGKNADPAPDFARVMERMRRLRAQIAPNDGAERFRALGVDVFLGRGRFAGRELVEVEQDDGVLLALSFKRALIATGARPMSLPVPGVADAGCLTNLSLFALAELPREFGDYDILELIARGFSYAEIARLQAVSVHTVQTHIKNLYRKLAVRSRGEAVFEATQLGLLGRAVA